MPLLFAYGLNRFSPEVTIFDFALSMGNFKCKFHLSKGNPIFWLYSVAYIYNCQCKHHCWVLFVINLKTEYTKKDF